MSTISENFDGPYTINIPYTVDGHNHNHKLHFDLDAAASPGADPANLNVKCRDGTTKTLEFATDEYVAVLRDVMPQQALFGDAIIKFHPGYKVPPQFITSFPVGGNGAINSPYVPAQQATFTFRTLEGGTMRIQLMENHFTGQAKEPLSSVTDAAASALRDYVTQPDTWFLGRDTSYVIGAINLLRGQNEKLFRARFR